MLLALWSPKGGSGTSVLAAACALVPRPRAGGARLADLGGDQPAIFGLGADPATGLADWLAAGPEAPTDALERLAVEAAPGVALIPRGAAAGRSPPPGGRGRRRARRRPARRAGADRRRRSVAADSPAARAVRRGGRRVARRRARAATSRLRRAVRRAGASHARRASSSSRSRPLARRARGRRRARSAGARRGAGARRHRPRRRRRGAAGTPARVARPPGQRGCSDDSGCSERRRGQAA